MEYNNFKNDFIKFFNDKENLSLNIINENEVLFIHNIYNYQFNYNIKILFEYIENFKNKNSYIKLSSIFNFDINLLIKETNLNEDQLLKIFERNKITNELLNQENLNLLIIARDKNLKDINKQYDITIAFNCNPVENKHNILRFTFDHHVTEFLDILELYRRSNINTGYIEWYHHEWYHSSPLQYSSYDDYIKCSIEKKIDYSLKLYLTDTLILTPNSYKHKYISNLVDIYKGDVYFSNKSFLLFYVNHDFAQYHVEDGIGHIVLSNFLINTNNNLDLINFSDNINDDYCTDNIVHFKNCLLINILNFIKKINII